MTPSQKILQKVGLKDLDVNEEVEVTPGTDEVEVKPGTDEVENPAVPSLKNQPWAALLWVALLCFRLLKISLRKARKRLAATAHRAT